MKQPTRRFRWQRDVADKDWNFTVGAKTTPQLRDGKARLIVARYQTIFGQRRRVLNAKSTLSRVRPWLAWTLTSTIFTWEWQTW